MPGGWRHWSRRQAGHQVGGMRTTQEFEADREHIVRVLQRAWRTCLWLSGSACGEWPIATAVANRLPIDRSVSDRDCSPRIRQDPSRRPALRDMSISVARRDGHWLLNRGPE